MATTAKTRQARPRRRPRAFAGPCIEVGAGSARLHVEPILRCLTPTQQAKLKPVQEIGRGTFATVYARPDRKTVVKITQDPTDVATTLLAKGDPRVVTVHDAVRLTGPSPPVYALVADRLRRPPKPLARIFSNVPTRLLAKSFDDATDSGTSGPKYTVDDGVRERVTELACARSESEREFDLCMRTTREIVDLHERMGRKGARLVDFHGGNVGVDRSGRWRLLDVGFSSSGEPAVPELAALRIVRRKRRC